MIPRLLLALALLASSPVALAEDVRPLAQALSGDARGAYEAGRALYAKGDYEGALAQFDRAHALVADPRLLWNMAACEKKRGRYARSIGLIDRYVAAGGALLGDDDRREAARARAALRPYVAAVTIATAPDGALVTVDDAPIATTPLPAPILLDAGEHRVRVSRRGFHTVTRVERVAGGAELAWRIDLPRIAVRLVVE